MSSTVSGIHAHMRFVILGCGSSGGVPRLGGADGSGDWGACDPDNPKNRRRRCALLIEQIGQGGTTRLVVDIGADFREQMLGAGVPSLDAVLVSHDHADHIHGIDDLRPFVLRQKRRMPVYTDRDTSRRLLAAFGYCFETPSGSEYPPILDLNVMPDSRYEISGEGGTIAVLPIPVRHGRIRARGFRFGDVAYVPDVSDFPDAAITALAGLELLIIDALRYTPHSSHLSVEEAVDWVEKLSPNRAILTNLHYDLDYEELAAQLPKNIKPAFDGLEEVFSRRFEPTTAPQV